MPAAHWTDSEAGVPGHGAVQGAVRQQRAVDVVGGVGRHGADHVRRVDVLEGDGEAGLLLEMILHDKEKRQIQYLNDKDRKKRRQNSFYIGWLHFTFKFC